MAFSFQNLPYSAHSGSVLPDSSIQWENIMAWKTMDSSIAVILQRIAVWGNLKPFIVLCVGLVWLLS